MFREEISGYAEPPRPPQKRKFWILIVLVVLTGLGIAFMVRQLTVGPRLPGWRLVGDWQSDNDPVFQRACYLPPKELTSKMGVYMADGGRGMREVLFKITSESHGGRHVEMAEYLPEENVNYRVRYTIAWGGKSLTREYDTPNGTHISCQYRYLGPPTEEVRITFQPWGGTAFTDRL